MIHITMECTDIADFIYVLGCEKQYDSLLYDHLYWAEKQSTLTHSILKRMRINLYKLKEEVQSFEWYVSTITVIATL